MLMYSGISSLRHGAKFESENDISQQRSVVMQLEINLSKKKTCEAVSLAVCEKRERFECRMKQKSSPLLSRPDLKFVPERGCSGMPQGSAKHKKPACRRS